VEALHHFGEPIIDILLNKVKEETISQEDINHIPLVLEKFASIKAVNSLIKLTVNTEHALKIESIEALRRLKMKNPHLKIKDRFVIDQVLDECELYQNTLSVIHSQIVIQYKKKSDQKEQDEENKARKALIQVLEQRLDRQLQRIFRFLGLKYPPGDMDPVLNIILTGKEEQRIHAIEFLDNILDNQLKKELIPIAESILMNVISEEKIRKLNLKVYSETECYQMLLRRNDIKLKQSVLRLMHKTNNPKFIPLIQMTMTDKNEKIRDQAKSILQQFQKLSS
jgi:AAA family ATP:ADP antiporter